MFKSIQYKLFVFTFLLIISVVGITCFIIFGQYPYAVGCGVLFAASLMLLNKSYKRFNQNILFLLNALDNGDYSFHFSETKLSVREKELNIMLNRIKDILTNARKEVIENEKFLSLIVESVSTGILIIDDRGVVQMLNQSAKALLGLSVFTHINQLQSVNEHFPALFHNLQARDSVQITVPNEREVLQINLNVSQIKLKRGLMKVFILNNIGNELENKEIESWIRLIRVMTHEIMNSIAPISSLSETLLSLHKDNHDDRQLRENTIEAFETIHTTAAGLLSFVESYRKFTSIPQPEKVRFPAKELLDRLIGLHEAAIRESGVSLHLQCEDNILLHADPKLLMQVLVNLLKNAIEAPYSTEEKRIIIRTRKYADKRVTIEVMNNGEPIPADTLANIFIPFFTTKPAGSGIGLSVSRYIMQLHGGKLQHSLSPEGYTVFQLIFIPG